MVLNFNCESIDLIFQMPQTCPPPNGHVDRANLHLRMLDSLRVLPDKF